MTLDSIKEKSAVLNSQMINHFFVGSDVRNLVAASGLFELSVFS